MDRVTLSKKENKVRKMLRFVTGSDIICVNKVEVLFTPVDGLARRPAVHTGGPALELP